ncbi:MAG: hypothetical protein ACRDDZ_01230 [Marinifilaceae bacterium]
MKKLGYIMLLLVITIMAGCASKKDLRTLEKLTIANVSVTPELWKQDGQQVPFQMQVQIQPCEFHKKWELTLLPQVETAAGIQQLSPIVFAGQRVKNDNAITVIKKEGYAGSQPYTFAYNPVMDKAVLVVTGILTHKGKEIARYMWKPYDSRIVAQPPVIPQDSAKKFMPGEMKAVITFKVGTTNVAAGEEYIKNVKENLQKVFSYKGAYLTKVIYSASCSPEGPLALNKQLARQRYSVGKEIFDSKLNLQNLPGYNNPGVVQSEIIAENWQALYYLMEDSSLENKYQLIDALKNAPTLEARQKILSGYIAKYPVFKEQYLVVLRNMWITIEYMVPYHKIEPTKYPPIGPFTR